MTVYLADPTSHRVAGAVQNLGDVMIKEAILDNLDLAARYDLQWVPVDGSAGERRYSRGESLILAGANLLANSPYSNPYVWRPAKINWLVGQYVILCGVGWWQYQRDPNFATRYFYKHFLRRNRVLHSVRDTYSKEMLRKCGVTNVLNTGCPSMWELPDKPALVHEKPESVVFTLTDYYQDVRCDTALVRLVLGEYANIYFFPQGVGDVAYLRSITDKSNSNGIEILDRSLSAYDEVLSSDSIDYVGTRLHGGIRALQFNKRAFIVSVDNRATEISRDTGLEVTDRRDLHVLREKIRTVFELPLKINRSEIDEFKRSLHDFLEEG